MRHLALTFALALVAAALAACGGGGEDAPVLSPQERIDAAAERIESVETLTFELTHPVGYSPIFPGVRMNRALGRVTGPETAELDIEAETGALGGSFLRLALKMDGDDFVLTDPLTGNPISFQLSIIPFNVRGMGGTLAGILRSAENPVDTGEASVGGVRAYGVASDVTSEQVAALVPAAADGLRLRLEIWVDNENLIRRMDIVGRLLSNDPAEITRSLELSDVNP